MAKTIERCDGCGKDVHRPDGQTLGYEAIIGGDKHPHVSEEDFHLRQVCFQVGTNSSRTYQFCSRCYTAAVGAVAAVVHPALHVGLPFKLFKTARHGMVLGSPALEEELRAKAAAEDAAAKAAAEVVAKAAAEVVAKVAAEAAAEAASDQPF